MPTADPRSIEVRGDLRPGAGHQNKFLNFYFRHIGVIETATEAAVYRHTWWLVVAGMTGVKEQYWAYRLESVRFRVVQDWTASRIAFFSWWNKENRVLILPILDRPKIKGEHPVGTRKYRKYKSPAHKYQSVRPLPTSNHFPAINSKAW